MEKSNFKVGLFIENGNTYLSLEYTQGNQKIQIHKIGLEHIEVEKETQEFTFGGAGRPLINVGTHDLYSLTLPLLANNRTDKIMYTITNLEEVPKEMSIKEIEKQLGYPIKIKGE